MQGLFLFFFVPQLLAGLAAEGEHEVERQWRSSRAAGEGIGGWAEEEPSKLR